MHSKPSSPSKPRCNSLTRPKICKIKSLDSKTSQTLTKNSFKHYSTNFSTRTMRKQIRRSKRLFNRVLTKTFTL